MPPHHIRQHSQLCEALITHCMITLTAFRYTSDNLNTSPNSLFSSPPLSPPPPLSPSLLSLLSMIPLIPLLFPLQRSHEKSAEAAFLHRHRIQKARRQSSRQELLQVHLSNSNPRLISYWLSDHITAGSRPLRSKNHKHIHYFQYTSVRVLLLFCCVAVCVQHLINKKWDKIINKSRAIKSLTSVALHNIAWHNVRRCAVLW